MKREREKESDKEKWKCEHSYENSDGTAMETQEIDDMEIGEP